MRRNALIVGFLTLFLTLLIGFQPVLAAAGCFSPAYSAYIPVVDNGAVEQIVDDFYIIQPQTTTNLVTNPSPRSATTGYTASGGSIARSTTRTRRGLASIGVTPTSGTTDGVYYGTVSLVSGTTYTFSTDILGVSGVSYKIWFGTTAGAILGTATTITANGKWQRFEVTYTESSSTTRRLYVTKNNSSSTGVFYVDGLQLEALSYSTTYCDGEQTGCRWSGTKNASTSVRSANYRGGGKKVGFQSLGAYLISQSGTGVAPVANQYQSYAGIDGGTVRRQVTKERSITLAFSVAGDGTAAWHQQRQAIINLIKSDSVYPQQPFTIGYRGSGTDVQLDCWYEDGFGIADGTQDIEAIPIKCLAPNPYWVTDGMDGTSLVVQQSVSNANNILRYDPSTGVWATMGTGGMNGSVLVIVQAPDGTIYAGGNFTTAGGTSAQYIAKWNGTSWSALGSATAINNTVYAIYVNADSSIYVGGSFTNAGGVAAADYFAKWDGSSWTAVGASTFNNSVYAIALGGDGVLYAGGAFTTPTGRVAYWTGSAWTNTSAILSSSVSPANFAVYTLARAPNGVYAGGWFDNPGGASTSGGIAEYNSTTGAWSKVSTGYSSTIGAGYPYASAMDIGSDGCLYTAGNFRYAGPTAALAVAKWNGTSFTGFGGFSSPHLGGTGGGSYQAYSLDVDKNLNVYVGSQYVASLSNKKGLLKVTPSSVQPLSIDPPDNSTVNAILADQNGYITIGFDQSGSGTQMGRKTVTNNGSAKTWPTITFTGPSSGTGSLYELKNITTGASLGFNLSLYAGETATLVLEPGNVSFTSTFRGNIMNTITSGSQTKEFYLLPGDNNIGVYMQGSSQTAFMTWQEMNWGVDSSAQ